MGVVEALVPKIQACNEPFADNHLHMAFAGLQGFGDCGPVRSVLSCLSAHVARECDRLPSRTGTCICQVLSDVHGAEADAILQSLRPRLEGARSELLRSCLMRAVGVDLPTGWTMHSHGSQIYYHHPDHGSQWSRPDVSLPVGWMAHLDHSGRTYYYHPQHGSQWQLPT